MAPFSTTEGFAGRPLDIPPGVSLLSELVDMMGFVIIPIVILRILKNLINCVTFSNDYLIDVIQFLRFPIELLSQQNVTILAAPAAAKAAKAVAKAADLSAAAATITAKPDGSDSSSTTLLSTMASYVAKMVSLPSLTKIATIAAMVLDELAQQLLLTGNRANNMGANMNANGNINGNINDVAAAAAAGKPVVLNNLLLKFSSSILECYPEFFGQYPKLLKLVTVFLYAIYSLVFSGYLVSSFLFFAACLTILSVKKWYEIDKFFIKVLGESNGVF